MTPREALLAAARSMSSVPVGNSAVRRTVVEQCQEAILALAEQEDQRGAAENTRRDESTSAGSTPAQSAPHPDPAGQVSSVGNPDSPCVGARPALPGPMLNERDRAKAGALIRSLYNDEVTIAIAVEAGGMLQHLLSIIDARAEPGPETVSVPRESMELLLDLLPRISDDDPMAPALADWCRGIRRAMLAAGSAK